MQVSTQSTTLLLARRDQPLSGALQIRREPDGFLAQAHGVDRHADLARQIAKQPPLPGCESLLTGAGAEHQLPDSLAAIEQGQPYGIGHRFAEGRDCRWGRALTDFDGGIGQLQRLLHRPDDGGQHGVGGEGGFQPLTQAGYHRIGLVALPVHEMVDGLLQPAAQRSEHQGNQTHGQQRDHEVPADLHHHSHGAHDEDIETDDAGGEGSVDQGALDDEVDVEEMVAQHRDADGQRYEQHDQVRREGVADEVGEHGTRRLRVRRGAQGAQGQVEPEKSCERHRDPEQDPLDLLPLPWARQVPVAVDLGVDQRAQRAQPDQILDEDLPACRVGGPGREDVLGQLPADPHDGDGAGPAGNESSVGKHVQEQAEAGRSEKCSRATGVCKPGWSAARAGMVNPKVAVPKISSAREANTATRSSDLRQKMRAATDAYAGGEDDVHRYRGGGVETRAQAKIG